MKALFKILCVTFILLFSGLNLMGQAPVNYNDVAVICNGNDTTSLSLGKFYMARHNIPANNLIIFKNTSKEIIDSATFEAIRKQIEDSLIGHKIQDKVNYLVTTTGCPLKVTRTDTCDAFTFKALAKIRCAAFDNELMLILGNYTSEIGEDSVLNPTTFALKTHSYYNSKRSFKRSKYGIYLVSRLQAANQTEAFNLVRKQGALTLVDKSIANFVIDDFIGSDTFLNKRMMLAANLLKSRKWKVTFNTNDTFLQGQTNVLGYVSWGFTDPYKGTTKGFPNNKNYLNGSIGVSYYSFNGYTFANNFSARSTFPRIIREGISGYFATVYEPYSFTFPPADKLFDMYTDTTQDVAFNMAESFFNASPTSSWMGMMVGDPKTSIITHIPAKPDPYVDTISKYVIGKGAKNIYANNIARGYWGWFRADTVYLKKLNIPYDNEHPLLYSKTKKLTISDTTFPVGKHIFSFVNQNISGTFYQQFEIDVTKFTGISDIISENTISIAPNPVKDVVKINSSPTLIGKNAKIQVLDISGKTVFQQGINLQINNQINLENIGTGIYLLQITDGKTIFHQKIVKE